jgi:acyl dehydratase
LLRTASAGKALKGLIEQNRRFLSMVFVGYTVYPALEVSELLPNRSTGVLTLRSTMHNQRGEFVMDGLQKYLIRKRPV